MASILPPTTTKTTTTSSTLYSYPIFKNTSKIPTIRKHNHSFNVSCSKAKDSDPNLTPPSQNTQTSLGKFDRRNMLIGLGGLYGAAGLTDTDPPALAAPVTAPDLSKCGAADLPADAKPTNCCPPKTNKIIEFKLPPPSNILRVRPAAHLADEKYIAKFSKALQLMKSLPDDDPRSFKQQSNIHCAYCEGAYHQVGFPSTELQVHNSWLFFPFHRFYLYFFEKILGMLLDDPAFAIPFWNWDSPAGMKIPAMYADINSPLYNRLRDVKHQPPTLIDLDYNLTDPKNVDEEKQKLRNLTIMYRQVVSGGKTPRLFLGSSYRAGDDPDPGAGSLENIPHGPVHIWCGDRTQPNLEDMGNFYSAGRDPIFYGHHANVDRIWTVWKTLGGKRNDFKDSDCLNSEFTFYDENAQLVTVKVKESLDHRKLGYVYQDVEIPWLNARPSPRISNFFRKIKNKAGIAMATETLDSAAIVFPRKLDEVVKVVVKRPTKSRSEREKEEEEEVVVVEGIEMERDVSVKFDVFINDEDEAASGPEKTEFAGSFVNVPRKHKHDKKIRTSLRLGITELLEDLEAEDDESVLVTLVPRYGSDAVTIGGVKIEFDS
uniref:Polyphenol oxidase n=1 Tax=Camellia sinensis TaxID=4442 RepID=A0A2Z5DH91_CAMSI|nr:polyphenol oxidase [Camellia sinensis]